MITEDQSEVVTFVASPSTHGSAAVERSRRTLWRRQLPRHANAVWNGYLAETGDLEGVPPLPLFLSCRAAVRAKTSATAANLQTDPLRRRELQEMVRDYLAMAQRHVD